MKKCLFALAALSLLFACTPEENGSGDNQPGVSGNGKDNLALSVTVDAKNVSAISAVLAGKANLGSTVASDLKVGFQYSKSAGILPSNSTTIEATDADASYNYSTPVTGLEPATKYYFRSFVRQNGQDTYGKTKEFITKDIASLLETRDAAGFEAAKATLNAKLDLTDIFYTSLAYGFLWGTSESALNADIKCTVISNNVISAPLTGLSPKTQYFYKAYVKLDDQTFYGEAKTFITALWVTSITLSKTSLSLLIGEEETIFVTSILPDDTNDKTYTWSSSDDAIASVDQNGKITAKAKGNTVIKATANDGSGVFASCSVSVIEEKVDLGIKTSDGKTLYWSTRNLCKSGFVNSPEDYGDYFAWGETDPKENYSWSTYKFSTSPSGPFSKYNNNSKYGKVDNKTVLEIEDDVANVKLGGKWRMPTVAEWTELRTKCTWAWSTLNDAHGYMVTASNGNSIFLPAAGYRDETDLFKADSLGGYWSSSLDEDNPFGAWGICLYSDHVSMDYSSFRCFGITIRPITE